MYNNSIRNKLIDLIETSIKTENKIINLGLYIERYKTLDKISYICYNNNIDNLLTN